MANVAEGLGTPAPGENVNSEAGFEAALAAKTGRTEELEGREPSLSTSIAEGLVEAGTAAARDEGGRFAASEPEEQEGEEETPADDEEQEDEGDGELSPEVQNLLAKHDGNAEAALAEALERHKNAESLIGRQGNDLGKLREELAELRGEVKAQRELAPAAQQQQAQPLSTEEIEEMIAEHGGQAVALWAVNNRPDLYDRVHRIWRVDEPDDAADFRLEYKLHQQRLELEAARAPANQPDEWVAAQKQQATINQALAAVSSEAEDWDAIAPHMLAALEQVPQRVAAMIVSTDPEERLDAVRIVADKARILSVGKAAAKTKQTEAATARKKSATVASGSLRPAGKPGGGSEEMTSEERQAAFKKALLAEQTTSVNEGLTYAKS